MKNPLGKILSVAILFAASALYGGLPLTGVNVAVKQPPNVKPIKQVVVDAKGNFTVDGLSPGKYAFAFRSPNLTENTQKFFIAVAGAKIKQDTISNQQLRDGIDVSLDVGPASKIRGQIRRLVWIPPELGSRMPGRWVEEDAAGAEARTRKTGQISKDTVREIQSRGVNMPERYPGPGR
jgi:hypothetical protein